MLPPAIDPTPIKDRWQLTLKPKLVPVEQVEALDWQNYFTWAGQLMKDNPPPTSDSALTSQFKAIGLTAEKGFDPGELSPDARRGLERAYKAGAQIVKMAAQQTGGVQTNGWAYNLNAGNGAKTTRSAPRSRCVHWGKTPGGTFWRYWRRSA